MSRTLTFAILGSLFFHSMLFIILNNSVRVPTVIVSPESLSVSLNSSGKPGTFMNRDNPGPEVIPETVSAEVFSPDPLPEAQGETVPDNSAVSENKPSTSVSEPVEPVSASPELLGSPGPGASPIADASGDAAGTGGIDELDSNGTIGTVPLDSLDLREARIFPPEYPEKARALGWEGDVTLLFSIDKKGRAQEVLVSISSGYEILDETAINTVKRGWRFPRNSPSPAVSKTFSFRLE